MKLIILRGYSGSGKSTWALNWLAESPDTRIRLNRDSLRESLFNESGVLSHDKETIVTQTQRAIATKAFENNKDVVLDDTNLRLKFAREWADFALKNGAELEVKDFHVDAFTSIARNNHRAAAGGRYVPVEAIKSQASRFPYPWPEITPTVDLAPVWEPVDEWDEDLLPAVLVDVDGTVALNGGHRGFYDWSAVSGDEPIEDVIELVNVFSREGYKIIFMSGRDSVCYDDTFTWLLQNVTDDFQLYMRGVGDNRKDSIVKHELFNQHIRGHYNVRWVVDDRLQVAQLWHDMGLTVLRVGDPSAVF